MKPLSLFGASGRTGRAMLELAHLRGVDVRALVRDSSVFEVRPGVEVRRGSLDSAADVDAAVAGTDAVCCIFGPRTPDAEPFCARGTERIVAAMTRTGVRRLVCLTGAMVGDLPSNVSIAMRGLARLFRRQYPDLAADTAEQERIVMASGLDWTLVKPPRLTDAPASHRVRAGRALTVGLLSHISRADLAGFMLEEVAAPRHLHERVYVRG